MKKEMWKSSAEKLRSTKWLALMAIFLALRIVVSRFSVPVAENLNISFSFVLVAFAGALFGPTAGMLFAAAEDILEFLLFPSPYGFFAGYTLSAMLGCLSYSLFLYDQHISILKITAAKAVSSFLVNVLLGSYWTYLLLGKSKAYLFYMTKSLVKNGVFFVFQVLVLILLFNLLIPYLSRHRFMKEQTIPLKWL